MCVAYCSQPKTVRQGFVLWASGIAQVPLVKKVLQQHLVQAHKRFPVPLRGLPVDERLRLHGVEDVFALGDCAHLLPKSLAAATDDIWTRAG